MIVSWPVLSTDEFVELSKQGMLWEFCGVESGMPEGRDVSCVQMVGGISPLQIGQQAKACQKVLFRNTGEKSVTILAGDVLGYAKLAGWGQINPVCHQAMVSHNLIHSVDTQ